MTLKNMIKQLKDMETLYNNAIVTVTDENGKEYHVTSICGFYGEIRPHECPDPHVVNINIKKSSISNEEVRRAYAKVLQHEEVE